MAPIIKSDRRQTCEAKNISNVLFFVFMPTDWRAYPPRLFLFSTFPIYVLYVRTCQTDCSVQVLDGDGEYELEGPPAAGNQRHRGLQGTDRDQLHRQNPADRAESKLEAEEEANGGSRDCPAVSMVLWKWGHTSQAKGTGRMSRFFYLP